MTEMSEGNKRIVDLRRSGDPDTPPPPSSEASGTEGTSQGPSSNGSSSNSADRRDATTQQVEASVQVRDQSNQVVLDAPNHA